MARPPEGARLVGRVQGSEHAKTRLRVILETLAGERRIASACADLGMNEAAFHKLRMRTLQDAVASLEPRPVGRPRSILTPEEIEAARLRAKNDELQRDLEAARLREEIAVTMPHVGRKRGRSAEKKTTSSKRRGKRR